MIRLSFLGAALLAVAVPASSGAQSLRTLSPAQMEEDLFKISEEFGASHAGRLRYSTEDEQDEVFGDALFEIAEEKSVLEFFRIVSRVVATVRCGHTGVQLGGLNEQAAIAAAGYMPMQVMLQGERAWVVESFDERLPLGAEIASVDGRSIAEIRAAAFSMMSGDGMIETGKERELERNFTHLYVLLVQSPDEVGQDYRIQLVGADAPVAVPGMDPDEHAAKSKPRPPRPLTSVTVMPEKDLAVIMVSQFGDRAGEPPFPEQLESCFKQANEAGVGNLVVDLRRNGGGNDNYGAELVSYMATKRFGYFERIEVTPTYAGPGDVVDQDGMRLVTAHRSLKPWDPAEHRFQGKVWLFEDGWTFSTAADVATVAHHNGFATLVGEESGGGYDGNTSGFSGRINLPNSGITVGLPKWMYVTANVGHEYPGRGAIPHHEVKPTIEDALAGRDVQLEFVIERIAGE